VHSCQIKISEKKNQTPVRGQDGQISDTRGKDFYGLQLVGDQKSVPWVSEIFPSFPLTGVRSFMSLPSQYLKRTFSYFLFNINHKTDMNINE
jgi:hypothetical protein